MFIKFLQNEEKRGQSVAIQWFAGAAKQKNPRTISMQRRLNTLYERYRTNEINCSGLLEGLANTIGRKK